MVAAILKKLDNIVKEYSGATANMFTAVICSFMFPDKFSFTVYIFMAMLLLFGGIYMYETQKVKTTSTKNKPKIIYFQVVKKVSVALPQPQERKEKAVIEK